MHPLHCYVIGGADERGNRADVTSPAKLWLDLRPCLLIFPFHKSISTLVLNKTIKTFVIRPFVAQARDIWRSRTVGYFTGNSVGLKTGQEAGERRGGAGILRRGSLCDAPLTAGALDGKVWGDALVTGVKVTLTVALGRLEVASGTAQTILPQVLEEMSGETHVDPGVTAAVEAGQQHGDDEGCGCRRWDSRGMLLRSLVQTFLVSRPPVTYVIRSPWRWATTAVVILDFWFQASTQRKTSQVFY